MNNSAALNGGNEHVGTMKGWVQKVLPEFLGGRGEGGGGGGGPSGCSLGL